MAVGSRSQRLAPDASAPDALSIGELYLRIERALDKSLPRQVWVSGEVRSFNVSSRGHCYLDLVDPSDAQESNTPVLRVKCWSTTWRSVRSTLEALGIKLDAGLVVRARGHVDLYKPRGELGFVLSELDTDALLGKVAAERARLVKSLVDEGLFEHNRRLPVPEVPLAVGLVCSPSTEGYRDFIGQLEGSGMAFTVRTAPTEVQGRDAPASVSAAIDRLQSARCDLIVIVRGGGSKADLATFDAEVVARAVATSTVPVWTGIGHTGDLSVTDEVANRAFITPTECGQELARAVTGYWRSEVETGLAAGRTARELLERSEQRLGSQRRAVANGTRAQLDRHADRLAHLARTVRGEVRGRLDTHAHQLVSRAGTLARCARRTVQTEGRDLAVRCGRLASLPNRRLEVEELRTAHWRRLLAAYDYHRQLERGYSVTRDATGAVVRSVSALEAGSLMETQLFDGVVGSEVTGVWRTDTDRRVDVEEEEGMR